MNKISAVYKITNKITGECYVGSSKNVYSRWANHKCPSTWKKHSNNRMYQDMQKYGVEQFHFEIIVPAAPTRLKVCEQEFIDIYHPTYNSYRANTGIDCDEYDRQYYQKYRNDRLEYQKQYDAEHKVERREYMREYMREYTREHYKQHKDEWNEYQRQYRQRKKQQQIEAK